MAQAFREVAPMFAGPVAQFATAAFLCGRARGRSEAGLNSAGPDDPEAVAAELIAAGGIDEQRSEINAVAEEVLRQLADTLYSAVAAADGVEVLSQWEGFTRFCRDAVGAEPQSLLRGFGLEAGDPVAQVRSAGNVAADETDVARWSAQWARGWTRRFHGSR
jgi:hypothetical protein